MKEWILYLQTGLFVERVARMLPKFLWPTLPLKAVNKPLFVWLVGFFLLSLRHFKCVSSRPSPVGLWEIDVPAVFGMPCELSDCMILLPEWVARFRVARSTHASRVCRLSGPLVPRAKLWIHTWQPLSLAQHSSAFICFLSRPWDAATHACLTPSVYLLVLIARCYPSVPGAAAGTCLFLCWHFTCNTGTYSCAVPTYCWMGLC